MVDCVQARAPRARLVHRTDRPGCISNANIYRVLTTLGCLIRAQYSRRYLLNIIMNNRSINVYQYFVRSEVCPSCTHSGASTPAPEPFRNHKVGWKKLHLATIWLRARTYLYLECNHQFLHARCSLVGRFLHMQTHADGCGWYEYKNSRKFSSIYRAALCTLHTYCIDKLVRCDRYDSQKTRDEIKNWLLAEELVLHRQHKCPYNLPHIKWNKIQMKHFRVRLFF